MPSGPGTFAAFHKKPPLVHGSPAFQPTAPGDVFLAKAIYNLPTTRHLIQRLQTDAQLRRLCGWDAVAQVPTDATFSRAFSEFAAAGLPAQVHEALIRRTQSALVINYIVRDSTAIKARQTLPGDKDKPRRGKQAAKAPKVKRRQGAKKGPHKRAKACQRGPRLQRQQNMSLPEMIADLPQECSLSVKTSSQGHQQYWRGNKLHWDVADSGRIPISCLLTGASGHDSQAAIPLMQMSAETSSLRRPSPMSRRSASKNAPSSSN